MQYDFYKYPLLADLLWFVVGRARGGSRTAATSKMEHFITKRSILDFPAALGPPLRAFTKNSRKAGTVTVWIIFVKDH